MSSSLPISGNSRKFQLANPWNAIQLHSTETSLPATAAAARQVQITNAASTASGTLRASAPSSATGATLQPGAAGYSKLFFFNR